jgi:PEGA domain
MRDHKTPGSMPGFLFLMFIGAGLAKMADLCRIRLNLDLMTIRTRRRIFYTLVALFFVVGGGIVGYADGWRIDFQTWRLTKIGGIYIHAFPENASIYLDGKPVQNQSGFLTPGTLISDLLPHTYSVVLKSAGYDDWQENAGVLAAQVIQYKYAVLVPANGTPVSSTTAKQIELEMNPIATTTDPFDQNQKLVIGKNSISLFNRAQATTTESVAILGKNSAVISEQWISTNLVGILQNDGVLSLYDTNANSGAGAITQLAETVKNFSATADGSMVAALEQNSLEIFSLDGDNNYYRFNLPDVADAQSVLWYKDDEHLFIVYPNNVSFLDLADSGLTNFTTAANGTSPFYDAQSNILYIKDSAEELVRFNFPS